MVGDSRSFTSARRASRAPSLAASLQDEGDPEDIPGGVARPPPVLHTTASLAASSEDEGSPRSTMRSFPAQLAATSRSLVAESSDDEPLWPPAVVETLLRERERHLRDFLETRNKYQTARAWSSVTLSVNAAHNRTFTSEQVKTKYKNLRAQFRKLQHAEMTETGSRKRKKKPLFWSALVNHFGSREERSHADMVSVATGTDDSARLAAERRSEEPSSPPRKKQATQHDLSDAVISAGDSIKEGLLSLGELLSSASLGDSSHAASPDLLGLIQQQTMEARRTNELLCQQAEQSKLLQETQNKLLAAIARLIDKS